MQQIFNGYNKFVVLLLYFMLIPGKNAVFGIDLKFTSGLYKSTITPQRFKSIGKYFPTLKLKLLSKLFFHLNFL